MILLSARTSTAYQSSSQKPGLITLSKMAGYAPDLHLKNPPLKPMKPHPSPTPLKKNLIADLRKNLIADLRKQVQIGIPKIQLVLGDRKDK
jgi:hypothetical protein